MGRRLGSSALVLMLALAALLGQSAASLADSPVFEEISPLPLEDVTAPGSSVGHGPDGQPQMYLMGSGEPAKFSVVNALTSELVSVHELPGAGGSWAVETVNDGDVYVGSYSTGHLHRYNSADDTMEDLGAPVPGQSAIWSLTHDENGVVYGGTGSDGHIFSYDPETGQTRDYGALATDDQPLLARSLTAGDGKIYTGVGSGAALYEIDAESGQRRQIGLPEDFGDLDYVYDLGLRDGLLVARGTDGGEPNPLHVYEVDSDEWVDSVDGAQGLFITPVAPDGRSVYFVKENTLHRYDLESLEAEATSLTGIGDARGFGFLDLGDPEWPGMTVVGLRHTGDYFLHNLETGESRKATAEAAGAPAPLRAMSEGPDGRVYFGSFLAGGLAAYDPETGEKELIDGTRVGQAEGMTQHDGAVYVGTYPSGSIWRYDPDEPEQPPEEVLSLYDDHGQSRPFGMASAGEYLAVGTVAKNGALGGGLTILDPETGEYWFDDVVPGQSVTALTYRDGVLYGTTSIYGGAGAPRPTETDAVLFAYDVEQREVMWQMAPLPGEGALGDVAFDKDGKLWTHSTVSVARIDAETREVEATRNYGSYPWEDVDHAWGAADVWIDPYDEDLYVVSQGSMYRIDPETLDRTRYFRPASQGLFHNNGNVFLSRNPQAWEYTPNQRTAAELQLGSDTVIKGQAQTVTATGLGADEPVEVWDRAAHEYLGTVRADQDGTLETSVPVTAAVGEARVELVRVTTRAVLGAEYEVVAASKDDCKDGGWQDFVAPAFDNQGECVAGLEASENAVGADES